MRAKTLVSCCVSGVSSSEVLCAASKARVCSRCFFRGDGFYRRRWGTLACRLSRNTASITAAGAAAGATADAPAAATATRARASQVLLLSATGSAEAHTEAARRGVTAWTGAAGTTATAAGLRRPNGTVVAGGATASQKAGAARGGGVSDAAAAAGQRPVAGAGGVAGAAPTAPAAAAVLPAVKFEEVETANFKGALGEHVKRLTATPKVHFGVVSAATAAASATARVSSQTATPAVSFPTTSFPTTSDALQGALQKADTDGHRRTLFSCPFSMRRRFQAQQFLLSYRSTSAADSSPFASTTGRLVVLRRLHADSNILHFLKRREDIDFSRGSFFSHVPGAYFFRRVAVVASDSTGSGGPASAREDKCRTPFLSNVSRRFLLQRHAFLPVATRTDASPGTISYRVHASISESAGGDTAAASSPLERCCCSLVIGNLSTSGPTRCLGSVAETFLSVDASAKTAAGGEKAATNRDRAALPLTPTTAPDTAATARGRAGDTAAATAAGDTAAAATAGDTAAAATAGDTAAAATAGDTTAATTAGDTVAAAGVGGRGAAVPPVTRTTVSASVARGRICALCRETRHWRRSRSFVRAGRQQSRDRGEDSSFSFASSKTPPREWMALLGVWPFLLFVCCVSFLLPGVTSVSFFGLDKPFSGAFLFSVFGVYGLWSVAEASDSAALKNFLTRNFLLSIENLREKRFHTIFTASLTHASPGHLLANVFIIGQLCRLLSYQLFPREFFSLFCLSSCMGAAGHFLTSRRPVVGASAFAYALLWTEAIQNSRELFRILPFPFLPVTALQFCQMAVVFECCMALLSRRYSSRFPWGLQQLLRSVSWSGHLGGLAAGCTYSWYKRTVEGDVLRWPSFLQLNRRYGLSDWTFTVHDLRDSLKILRLECKLLTSSSELEKTVVLRVLEKLRAQKEFRRMAVAHGALLR